MANPKRNEDYVFGTIATNAPANIIGFARVINSQEVRKNLRKHGDPANLVAGQPPLAAGDFALIPTIVERGEHRVIGAHKASKPLRVEYRARIEGVEYVYVETVGRARKRVALPSFYRK